MWRLVTCCLLAVGAFASGWAIPWLDSREEASAPAPYPRGPWRLASLYELNGVMLWPAHVLVRYRGTPASEVPFSNVEWHTEPLGVDRTREEALALAEELERRARREPHAFAELAREHSDDASSRPRGGALGGVPAPTFLEQPGVLDALSSLSPGEVSRVIETRWGFHVFQLRAVPVAEQVTGRHLVIGHRNARWLQAMYGRGAERARGEALALAHSMHRQAREDPAHFEQLIRRHSDHPDSVLGGDFGTWSTHEATPYVAEIEELRGLAEGEVGELLETAAGFVIVQRVSNPRRPRHAAALIQFPFDEADAASEQAARERADGALATLRSRPSQFSALQRKHCCVKTEEWTDGRGEPALESALSTLAEGEIGERVVRSRDRYVIARRVAASPAPDPEPMRFDFPAPAHPELRVVLSELVGECEPELASILSRARVELDLTPSEVRKIEALAAGLDQLEDPERRLSAFRELLEQVERVVGHERHAGYLAILRQHFADLARSYR